MTRPYSIESITSQLHNAGLPLAKHFARALVALLTAKKISLYHVAALMAGKTNDEIGLILGISSYTVKNHLKRIYRKLGVFSRAQAVARYAARAPAAAAGG